jgi:hypothetical protein
MKTVKIILGLILLFSTTFALISLYESDLANGAPLPVWLGYLIGILIIGGVIFFLFYSAFNKKKEVKQSKIEINSKGGVTGNTAGTSSEIKSEDDPKLTASKTISAIDSIHESFLKQRKTLGDLLKSHLISSEEFDLKLLEIERNEKVEIDKLNEEQNRKYNEIFEKLFVTELTKWTSPLIDKLNQAKQLGLLNDTEYLRKKEETVEDKRRLLQMLINDGFLILIPEMTYVRFSDLPLTEMGRVNKLEEKMKPGEVIVRSIPTRKIELKTLSEWKQIVLMEEHTNYSYIRSREKQMVLIQEVNTGVKRKIPIAEWIKIVMTEDTNQYKVLGNEPIDQSTVSFDLF